MKKGLVKSRMWKDQFQGVNENERERERVKGSKLCFFFFFGGGSDFLSLKPSFFLFSFFLSLPDLNYKFLSFLLDSTIKWDRQKNPFLSKSLSFSFSFFIFPFSTTQKISKQSRAFFILLCFFICVHFFFFSDFLFILF